MVRQWPYCQEPGVLGSALTLVRPVSVYCGWMRQQVQLSYNCPFRSFCLGVSIHTIVISDPSVLVSRYIQLSSQILLSWCLDTYNCHLRSFCLGVSIHTIVISDPSVSVSRYIQLSSQILLSWCLDTYNCHLRSFCLGVSIHTIVISDPFLIYASTLLGR